MNMQEFQPLEDRKDPGAEEIAAFDSAKEAVQPTPLGDIIENEDGSVTILDEVEEEERDSAFDDNLADGYLDKSFLDKLGLELVELVESDKRAREKRDKQYAEGIKRTGLGNEAPGGADFEGSSKAVHPMLAKGCIDFASKAIKELFPAAGPCKTQIIGESTEAKVDRAERKRNFMNYQLTTQVPENRSELEKLLSQVGLGGSQYKRWWWDAKAKRPRTEVIYIDDMFLPYSASDFKSACRRTHRQWVSAAEFEARMESGLYVTVENAGTPSGFLDRSKAQAATDKVEGAEEDVLAYNEDGNREVFTIYLDRAMEGDKLADEETAPYIAHVDKSTSKVLGLYRNWKEGDDTFTAKSWVVEYNFIPWRGAQAIGLGHIIGSLSAAATGSLRAILDSAHIQNFPGAVKLKAGRTAGQNLQVNATEIQEIDAPPGVDDIRKIMMPFPFNGPSAVLFNVLEWLTQQAEVVVATASEKIADGAKDMPVGTAMALIEHGSTNFSAIHARMHASMKEELAIVHRLNGENLEDEEVIEDLGELTVSRKDFQGPMDIIPVSDPNIFTEAQRYAQFQALVQLKSDPVWGPMFKQDRLLQRGLKLLQIPAPEDIANLPKDPQKTPALMENFIAASKEPRPLKAYEDQDDLAHLMVHTQFMTSPVFGSNPLIGGQALPALLEHCKEHLLNFYRKHTEAAAESFIAASQAARKPVTEEDAAAYGAAFADKMMVSELAPQILPALEAAQKAAAGMAPKPPVSPDVAHAEQNKMAIAQLNAKRDADLKAQELAYQTDRDEKDREVTRKAGQLAAMVEQLKDSTAKQLTQFKEFMQATREEAAAQQATALLELQSAANQQLEVVKAFLANMQAEQQDVPQVDFTGLLQPLLDGVTKLSEDVDKRISGVESNVKDNHLVLHGALQDAVSKITEQSNNTLLGMVKGLRKPKSSDNSSPKT